MLNTSALEQTSAASSDDVLVGRWRAGDRRAGDRLIARHVGDLRAYFYCRVKGPDCEDLVQETLWRLTRAVHRYEARSSFRTYLLSIARNTLKDHLRRCYRRVSVQSLEDEVPGKEELAERVLLDSERYLLMLDSIWSLSAPQRDLVVRFYLREVKARHIAREAGIPEGTVRRWLFKARKDMREHVERRQDERVEDVPVLLEFVDEARKTA